MHFYLKLLILLVMGLGFLHVTALDLNEFEKLNLNVTGYDYS